MLILSFSSGNAVIIKSSAYARILPSFIKLDMMELLCVNIKSNARLKKMGLSTPPCGTPEYILMILDSSSSYITFRFFNSWLLIAHKLNHLLQLLFLQLSILNCIALSNTLLGILSNAAAISKVKIIGLLRFCTFLNLLMCFFTLKIFTKVPIPAWNPVWYLSILKFSHVLQSSKFLLIIFSIILIAMLWIAIGLVLSTGAQGFPVFDNNINLPTSISFGKI